MSLVNLEYLFEEPTNLNEESLPDYASLDFLWKSYLWRDYVAS